MIARFKGTCGVCDSPIEIGDEIEWGKEKGQKSGEACHANCLKVPSKTHEAVTDATWKRFTDWQREQYKKEHGVYPPPF